MKVDVIGDFSMSIEPVRLDARTVILRDEFHQPLLIAQALDNGQILVTRAGEPDFQDALKSFGADIKVNYRSVRAPS